MNETLYISKETKSLFGTLQVTFKTIVDGRSVLGAKFGCMANKTKIPGTIWPRNFLFLRIFDYYDGFVTLWQRRTTMR
jgi:hypothetical protein